MHQISSLQISPLRTDGSKPRVSCFPIHLKINLFSISSFHQFSLLLSYMLNLKAVSHTLLRYPIKKFANRRTNNKKKICFCNPYTQFRPEMLKETDKTSTHSVIFLIQDNRSKKKKQNRSSCSRDLCFVKHSAIHFYIMDNSNYLRILEISVVPFGFLTMGIHNFQIFQNYNLEFLLTLLGVSATNVFHADRWKFIYNLASYLTSINLTDSRNQIQYPNSQTPDYLFRL